ncbi:YidH family protein [Phycicoccus duodecadis]|uniref:Putative membrane protein n=1 Tax=Phycicoccus duodecadis TaxID=173053 RepID=A0A2N3YHK8_9MICO|nr:DUF202 domain-containing protein [Phycicoccus duodecadis]PKW26342.1 putative membrane protein [Phycicoccus duodecadis]
MNSEKKRWPASVYGRGTDPDARFSLANERTFLAWIRTGLALLAGAAALDALDLPLQDTVQGLLSALLALAGIVVAVTAFGGWMRIERAMREETPLPSNPAMPVVVVALVVVGVVLAVSAVLGGVVA